MPPVSNDRSTGAAPTPVTGSTTSFSTPQGAACEVPGTTGGAAAGGTSPGVKVVPHDIPGARPVGAPGATATATSAAGASGAASAASRSGAPSTADVAGAAAVPGSGAAVNPDQCVPDPNYHPNPAQAAFERIKTDLGELKEYASYYVAAKVDGIKGTVRNIGLYAALGVVGAIVGGAILATAAGLLVVGIAHGLGALFGGRYWLGDLVTGILILGVVAGGAYYMMNKLTGTWRSQTLKKYEQRKQTQRERFRRDVSDRAQQAAAAQRAAAAAAARSGGSR